MESFNTYFLDVIKNKYAEFNGRARRKEYWMFCLFTCIIGVVLGILLLLLLAISPTVAIIAYILMVLFSLALIVPSLALTVRRLHDTNKSGWFWFINFVPAVGGLIMLYFMILEGDKTENPFGPDPKAAERV